MAVQKVVWDGPKSLRRMLVPIAELTSHPGNPRVHNLDALAASLERFGQRKTIAASADKVVTAGNGTMQAALKLGWTHLAVAVGEEETDADRDAYVLADNRTHDLGGYDTERLSAMVGRQIEEGQLDGTGYTEEDYDHLLIRLQQEQRPAAERPPRDTGDGTGAGVTIREIVLAYSDDQHRDMSRWLGMLRTEWEIDGLSEIVYRAVRDAAKAR